jgi:hypothetical protein
MKEYSNKNKVKSNINCMSTEALRWSSSFFLINYYNTKKKCIVISVRTW